MGYYIDLKTISIESYKEILKKTEFIPSWKILENDIDDNLEVIKQKGIQNLEELLIALKDKNKIIEFSSQTGLSEQYLGTLNRVVKGYRQKPNRIKDFACVDEDIILKLEGLGIKNTMKLYPKVLSGVHRNQLAKKLDVSKNEVLKLAKLTDLSRIRWVNHTFAYVLLESGYDTVGKVATADSKEMYERIKQLNKEREIYNAYIGERDMRMVIESANSLELEIEY